MCNGSRNTTRFVWRCVVVVTFLCSLAGIFFFFFVAASFVSFLLLNPGVAFGVAG